MPKKINILLNKVKIGALCRWLWIDSVIELQFNC